MNTSIKHDDDIKLIRQMMERSSKFLSLSGLSGIFAGICAIIGASVVQFYILPKQATPNQLKLQLISVALIILVIAFTGTIFFSYRKAKKTQQTLWNKITKRILLHLFIPLIAGGLFSIILIPQNPELIPAVTLIFYGMALVNAGKFTFGEILYLGIIMVVLGLFAGVFTNFALYIWALGFGLTHIIYGLLMYQKYER